MASGGTQTVYQYNQTQLPQWYTDYMQGITGQVSQLQDQPYVGYTGPRTAGLTADELNAYGAVRSNQGSWIPFNDQATRVAEGATGINFDTAAAAGDKYIGKGTDLLSAAGDKDTASSFDPYAKESLGLYRAAGEGDTFTGSSPYVQQAANMNGLASASPYLSAASGDFPSNAGRYMSPYTAGVTDKIADLGARNLGESLLPQISDDFIKSGQYGSTRQRDLVGRAIRDTNESVLAEQARSLEAGYGTAGQLYNQDASRYAGLAGTAGNLGLGQGNLSLNVGKTLADIQGSDLNRQLTAGQGISSLGQFTTESQAADAARKLQAGQSIGSLGVQRGQLGLSAAGNRASTMLDASQQFAALGDQRQQQGLTDASSLENIGQTQRGINQQNLNTAYGDFTEQRDYPWQQISRGVGIVGGQQLPTSTTTQGQTQGGGPSTAAQVGGAIATGLGLYGALRRAKGGPVKKPKRVSSYGRLPPRGLSSAMMMEAA